MFSHYYTGKVNGSKVHYIHLTNTPLLMNSCKFTFAAEKEAKAFAKQQGAKAWNY